MKILDVLNRNVEGFERVNLIGGKNDSGKTALLEALLLCEKPHPLSILEIQTVRQEFTTDRKKTVNIWDNFFYNQQTKKPIVLNSNDFNIQIDILKSMEELSKEEEIDPPICIEEDDYDCLEGLNEIKLTGALQDLTEELSKRDIQKIGIVLDQDNLSKQLA